MTMKSKLKNFFALDETYEYSDHGSQIEEDKFQVSRSSKHLQSTKQNVVNLQSVQNATSKMILFEPMAYSEAQEIADHLKNRRSVVINLQKISRDQALRIVDFLSGTVYAVGGEIQKIGSNIFLCTPDNVDVSGNISDSQIDEELSGKRW